ncbi:histidine phosphotransferase family protein [Hyphomonadaceae bacterium ML37]|nr:histidine phosphotransferase family protein [Hyphomonadaceae bacterium ML37]
MSTHIIPSASELAALLASRVCHDFANPVQGMNSAIGVLDDPNAADMREDALALLRSGVRQLAAKIEYARVCFGAGGTRGGEMSLTQLQTLSTPMFSEARAELAWKSTDGVIDKTAARILLNLIWLAVDALPRGGTVTVEAHASAGGGARLRVVSAGPRLRLDPSYVVALRGERPEDGFDGRSVQPYYAGLLARESGGRAEASVSEERIEFSALTGPGQRVQAAE